MYNQNQNNQGFNQNQNFNNQNMNNQQGYNQQGYQQQQAPQQQYSNNVMSGSFTAESAGVEHFGESSFKRNPNVQPIPEGTQIASIYKVIDIGTQVGFKDELKRQIKVYFELPQYCQQFNMDKPDLMPSVISNKFNFFTGSQSKLRQLMNAVSGRSLSDDEASNFDFQSLLGQLLIITVQNKPKQNDPNVIYSNITNYSAINYNMVIVPQDFSNPNVPRNPITAFYLGKNAINLTTEYFANLPLNDRKTIMNSNEAKNFLAAGGIVFRNTNNEKDTFYPGAVNQGSNGNQPNAQSNGFTPINQNPQGNNVNSQSSYGNNSQAPNGANFQQQQYQQQPPQQHAFGQSVHQAMQNNNGNNGQFAQQQQPPQQNFNQQPNYNANNNQQGNGAYNNAAPNVQNQEAPNGNGVPQYANAGTPPQQQTQGWGGNNQQGSQQAPQQNQQQGFPSQQGQDQQMGNNGGNFNQNQPQVDDSFSKSFNMDNDDIPF